MFKQSLMKNSDMAQNALMKKGGVYQTAVVMKQIAYSSVTYKYLSILYREFDEK